jgi:hypothetical protein
VTRTQQTLAICGTVALCALLLGLTLAPEEDLSHLHPVDRCDYRQYWKKHGGTVEECKRLEMENVTRRVRSW